MNTKSSRMRVSVIIPAYNREGTVLASVESALAQSYGDLEVIVVDDGSTDRTVEVLQCMAGRIKVVCQPNAGPSAARNRGVAESSGDIVAFLDSDDHWMPNKIERQVKLMTRGGDEMVCCVCNATVKGEGGSTLGNTFEFAGVRPGFEEGVWTNAADVLSTRFLLFNQVVAVRREAFDRVGGFNEKLRLLEDYELSLRLATAGTWGVIRDPLVMKFNDTNGIGVECMTDREWHARVRTEVISGLLEGGHGLGESARSNLKRSLADLNAEMKALTRSGRPGGMSRVLGRASQMWLRVRRAVWRRSPSWPKFEGMALEV